MATASLRTGSAPMLSRSYILLPDERLARLAGDGNDAAFAALHRRYDAVLHGYTRSIARDGDDAADALQNAWIAALIALRADRRTAPVRPWLFRIAHNAAIDVLRRKAAAVRPIDRGQPMVAASADDEYARSETVAEVVADMRDLPTNQRAALVMRELGDLDYSEIAIALTTSEGNARQLVFAARDGLRESRAGRALSCDAVRGVVARADRRELRRRRLRAHLSACAGCSDYADSFARPGAARKVAGYAPAPALLQAIFAAAGGSTAAVGTGAAGGSFAGLAKGAVAAAVIVAGVGTTEVVVHRDAGGERQAVSAAALGDAARAGGDLLSPRAAKAAIARPPAAVTGVAPARRVARTIAAPAARRALASGKGSQVTSRPVADPVTVADRAARSRPSEPLPESRGASGGRDDRPHRDAGPHAGAPDGDRVGAGPRGGGYADARPGDPGGAGHHGLGRHDGQARGARTDGGDRDCPPGDAGAERGRVPAL